MSFNLKYFLEGLEESKKTADFVPYINANECCNEDIYEDDCFDDEYVDDEFNNWDWERESWYAMTDGMYGEMPDDFDGDYSFLGY